MQKEKNSLFVWQKVDSVLLLNYHSYSKNPLINKYVEATGGKAPSEQYEGMLLLRKKGKPIWISHPFNYEQAKKEINGVEVKKYSNKKTLQKLLTKYTGKRVGYDSSFTSVGSLKCTKKLLKGKKVVDVSKELAISREIKNAEEIKKIKKAVKETEKVLAKIINDLKEGENEEEVAKKINKAFEEDGFEQAFCIVAFGENTTHIHHVSGSKRLEKESPVLIDCGAKWKGYVSDITKSFWFGEKEAIDYSKTKQKVINCLKKVEEKLKDGVNARELWKETNALGKEGLIHALSHGIGIEEHDYPIGVGEKCKLVLKEGMVLAIEPAIYGKKFGIRIENDYLITKKGFERL